MAQPGAGAASSAGAATIPAMATPIPPEVQQVAPALVALATDSKGASTLTVSLHPRDLGEVQIHLVRARDGATSLTVTADRAETLQQLAQNAHQLHAALDAADLPSSHRIVTFTLTASLEQGLATADRDAAQGNLRGGNEQHRQSSRNGPGTPSRDSSSTIAGSLITGAGSAARRWVAAGLNITA